jgi:hypothetical protein
MDERENVRREVTRCAEFVREPTEAVRRMQERVGPESKAKAGTVEVPAWKVSWTAWMKEARAEGESRYGLRRVPRDSWRSLWAMGMSPAQAAKAARDSFRERARA